VLVFFFVSSPGQVLVLVGPVLVLVLVLVFAVLVALILVLVLVGLVLVNITEYKTHYTVYMQELTK